IMGRRQIRRLPVVENGALLGMVSIGDLAVKQGNQQETGKALKDVSQGVKEEGILSQSGRPSQVARQENQEGVSRQGRVVPIRPEGNAPPRKQQKSSKPKAS